MSEDKKAYRVMWSLDILPDEFVPEFARNTPNEHMFRIAFATKEDAQQFVAELQRFMGHKLLHLLDEGIEIKVKP